MISMMCVSGLLLLIPHAPPVAGQTVPTEYAVGPGDVLTVIVFGEPELSGSYTVDSDGSFDFPLLECLCDLEQRQISSFHTTARPFWRMGICGGPRSPSDVEQFRSQSVFVMGEVRVSREVCAHRQHGTARSAGASRLDHRVCGF